MLPTLFEVGGVGVPAYFVFTWLGYGTGFWLLHRGARRILADTDHLVGLYMSLFVSGWFGARLMHIVGGQGFWRPQDIATALVSSMGGIAFLGGVLGGTIGALVYMRLTRLPIYKLLDVAAPALMFGLAFGRVGCTLAGCCHGREVPVDTWSPLWTLAEGQVVAVDVAPFFAFIVRENCHGHIFHVPVYPTQWLEVLASVGLGGFLIWMNRSARRFDGQAFAVMLALYGIFRFWNEGFRGDPNRGAAHSVAGWVWSTGEFSSVLVVGLAVGLVALRWRTGVAPEPVVRVDPDDDAAAVADLPDLSD